MNEIVEKHFKYTAAKTSKIKSENQVKGKVKTIVICTTSYESHTFFHEFAVLSK
jgi:hypothetical protein